MQTGSMWSSQCVSRGLYLTPFFMKVQDFDPNFSLLSSKAKSTDLLKLVPSEY